MKHIYTLAIISLLIAFACKSKKVTADQAHLHEQVLQSTADTVKKSIPKEEHALVGSSHITIKYYAPAVRGRQIWGGLVPFDEVWVTGAHRATSFEINKDFTVEGKLIKAGKYALFTIPGKEKWIFIINKKWDQHLADDYNASDDVIRVEVAPKILNESIERLKYRIKPSANNAGELEIQWEKISLTIPFLIKG